MPVRNEAPVVDEKDLSVALIIQVDTCKQEWKKNTRMTRKTNVIIRISIRINSTLAYEQVLIQMHETLNHVTIYIQAPTMAPCDQVARGHHPIRFPCGVNR